MADPSLTTTANITPPTIGGAAHTTPSPVASGRGRFTMLYEHARGGLGTISVACDEQFQRHVAVKTIRTDKRASDYLRERFLTEAAITGQLEHPGIVPIYALESDQQGQPYYAMRLIRGETLSAAIKSYHAQPTSVGFRDLLQRFTAVCQTVAYAHSQNVIHRDLKPTNVLLGAFGETLVVDWGLARRLGKTGLASATPAECETAEGQSATDTERLTHAGQVLGTPAYMSPEQATAQEVGTATDIYSLGTILYELLTGKAPFAGESGQAALDLVRQGPPADPEQVNPDVSLALGAICRKAMARTPADRYPTAAAIAEDVNRWLADEAVSAYREPWPNRAGRWMRRHRALVTGGVAAALVTATALAVFAVLMLRHTDQLAKAWGAERAAKNEAQRNFKEARTAVNQYFDLLREDEELNRTDLHALQARLFAKTLPFYERLTQIQEGDAELDVDRARAFHRLAFVQQKMGDFAAARSHYEQAASMWERLAIDSPTVATYRQQLATTCNNLGVVLESLEKRREAEAAYLRTVTIREQLVGEFPDNPVYLHELGGALHNLANFLNDEGQTKRAITLYQQAIQRQQAAVARDPKDRTAWEFLGNHHNNMGLLLHHASQLEEAVMALRQALTIQEKLVADFPRAPEYRHELARSHCSLGNVLRDQGKRKDAEDEYRGALAIQEKLAADFRAVPEYLEEEGFTHTNIGNMLRDAGELGDAEAAYRSALTIQEKLAAEFPAVSAHRSALAGNYVNFGHLLQNNGKLAGSVEWYDKALTILVPLTTGSPRLVKERMFLRNAYWGRASALSKLSRHAEAISDWDKAIAVNDQPEARPGLAALRIAAVARSGEHAKATADADAMAAAPDVDGGTLNVLAKVFAISAASVENDAQLRERYASRAVELLRQTAAKGYKDIEQLKKEDDFRSLRDREDFKRLLRELEAAKK